MGYEPPDLPFSFDEGEAERIHAAGFRFGPQNDVDRLEFVGVAHGHDPAPDDMAPSSRTRHAPSGYNHPAK